MIALEGSKEFLCAASEVLLVWKQALGLFESSVQFSSRDAKLFFDDVESCLWTIAGEAWVGNLDTRGEVPSCYIYVVDEDEISTAASFWNICDMSIHVSF